MKIDRIQVRVTQELKLEIKEAADKLGMNMSQYLIYLHKINNK